MSLSQPTLAGGKSAMKRRPSVSTGGGEPGTEEVSNTSARPPGGVKFEGVKDSPVQHSPKKYKDSPKPNARPQTPPTGGWSPTVPPNPDGDGDGERAPSEEGGRSSRSSQSGGHSSATGSSSNMSNMSAFQMMKIGPRCLRKVPFEYQVIAALAIPMAFMIGYGSATLHTARAESAFLDSQAAMLRHMTAFEGEAMKERGTIGAYLGHTQNATLAAAGLRNYRAQCARTDSAWAGFSAELRRRGREEALQQHAIAALAAVHANLAATRAAVEFKTWPRNRDYDTPELAANQGVLSNITGTKARDFYTNLVIASQGVVRAIAKDPRTGRSQQEVGVLLVARQYVNMLGVVRGCGNELVNLDAPATAELVAEFAYGRSMEKMLRGVLREMIASTSFLAVFDAFVAANNTQAAMALIDTVASENRTRVTSAQWFPAMSAIIADLDAVLLYMTQTEFGREARTTMRDEALKMVFAVATSVVATSFIVFWQIQIANNVGRQKAALLKMNDLVSSFVPRAFLRTMGARSLSHAEAGSHSEVATTMVFCSIRNFTGLTDGMTNEALFHWLQSYFGLMTRVTDHHHGTIDKFIGDAIFAFFGVPTNAVRCGVEWQTVANFLNSQLGSENMIRIGVGIHHGVAAFGIFGDTARKTCTLVSKEVNFASRLEGLTKQYGVRILCSAAALEHVDTASYQQTGDLVTVVHGGRDTVSKGAAAAAEAEGNEGRGQGGLCYRFLGNVQVKGSDRTHEVYEIFQADEWMLKRYKAVTKHLFEKAARMQQAIHGKREFQDVMRRTLALAASVSVLTCETDDAAAASLRVKHPNVPGDSRSDASVSAFDSHHVTSPLAAPDGAAAAAAAWTPKEVEVMATSVREFNDALVLLDKCEKVAELMEVRDPVIAVKRRYINSTIDAFHEK